MGMASRRLHFDDDEEPEAELARTPAITLGSPEYNAWWKWFHAGAADVTVTPQELTELSAAARSGYRIGRLFRPLQVTKETRR